MAIKGNFLVEKRNVLNELRSNGLTLQELRFFSIYLAKINARDISTRIVKFDIYDFLKIMDLSKLNLTNLRNTVDGLLCKIVGVPMETGGFRRFQLFKECVFTQDAYGDWYIEIDAHDSALPLMFEFKEKYFTYKLWNALRLKSTNQIRMYEILKQYEYVGERTVELCELRGLLGIEPDEYPRFTNFKSRVLDACQKALETYSDIKYTYELLRRGKNGKITAVVFYIEVNEDYNDQLSIFEYMNEDEFEDDPDDGDGEDDYFAANIFPLLSDACNDEFSLEEVKVLFNDISCIAAHGRRDHKLERFGYLKRKYDELNYMAKKSEIGNRFGYLRKLIKLDTEVNSQQ